MKYLLDSIWYLSSYGLFPPREANPDDSLSFDGEQLTRGTLASFAISLLIVGVTAPSAQAWEKKASLQEDNSFQSFAPNLTIKPVVSYEIQAGDTLWELSQQYETSPTVIASYNDLASKQVLQVGETIEIPLEQGFSLQEPQILHEVVGGRGGAISSEAIMVESSSDQESISPVPQIISQGEEPSSADGSGVISELPIQTFLADVQQLRATYGSSPLNEETEAIDVNSSASYSNQRKVFAPGESSSTDDSRPNSIATAPIKIEFYNRFLYSPIGETVSPELPPLSSPDQYLPNSTQQFEGYIWPAKGVFTSGYGMRWGRMHRGIDIAAPIGTPIVAAAPGEVVVAGWSSGGYGNLVKLKHPDGSLTLYAHNNRVLVRKGQEVDQGQQIAEMGSTGRSTGPHLHFEIHPPGKGAVNPLAYLPER